MATLRTSLDDDDIRVVHNPQINQIVIRVGYSGSVMLRDLAEATTLVEQLQTAIRAADTAVEVAL